MGDLFLFCSQYILIASATDICHLQNDAQHCYELTQPTLSFHLPDFPSSTSLLQALPWEEFMYLHGSWISPVVCHRISCNEFPKHCGFEWLLSHSLFFVWGSWNTSFSALERHQDVFHTSKAEKVHSACTCLVLSARCQAVPCRSSEITVVYRERNKLLNTTGLL